MLSCLREPEFDVKSFPYREHGESNLQNAVPGGFSSKEIHRTFQQAHTWALP